MKYIKYFLISVLVLYVLITIGGIIKYNVDLNGYIDQKEPVGLVAHNDSLGHETEVYIVGSVHFETNKIKRADLYQYIDSISPSIILYEGDTNSVNRMLNRTDFFMQLLYTFNKKNKVESFVTHKYIKDHPECEVLPYEWEERDSFHFKHDYRSTSAEMISSLNRLHRENLLDESQSSTVEEYLALNRELSEIERNGTLYDLNNKKTDSLIKNRQMYMYKHIPKVIKERTELATYKDFAPIHMEYWDIRNKAMAENI